MKIKILSSFFVQFVFLFSCNSGWTEPASPLTVVTKMPVKEVTVFKDGSAFVIHEGKMPIDSDGNVLMDYLPTPILGTFWPYSADKNAKLSCVVASQHKVIVPHTPLNLTELLEANSNAEVSITELTGAGTGVTTTTYDATIVGVPVRNSAELESTSPPNSGEQLPQKGDVILLKTINGVSAVPLSRIQTVTFKGSYGKKLNVEEFRNLLALKLDWASKQAGKTADVGLMYLQNGLRWIPSYKITIDDGGKAAVKLQATLVNELCDLDDVTANLVIGVPNFAFRDSVDPIALQQTVVSLSPYLKRDSRQANYFSNAIMAQAAAPMVAGGLNGEPTSGPQVSGSAQNEDLYVFTVKHITLKKGQRMVVPVSDCDLKYKDVYTLDVPYLPPPEVCTNISNQQQMEIMHLLNEPKVMHKIRLSNKSSYPLTTAPALVIHDDQVLGQGMMTYTAIGANTDLDLTTAVDVKVKKTDKETKRTPNAVTWQSDQYGRIDLSGTIELTNYQNHPVDLEVTREILGAVGTADHNGVIEMVNVFEGKNLLNRFPDWWGWYSWPTWWHHFNGVGRITWKLPIEAQGTVKLGYNWYYFWR